MADLAAVVQRYYGDRPALPRIDDALRAAGVDPQTPSHHRQPRVCPLSNGAGMAVF